MKKYLVLVAGMFSLFTLIFVFCFIGLNKKNSISKEINIDGNQDDADGVELNWEKVNSEKTEEKHKHDITVNMKVENIMSYLVDTDNINPNFKSSVASKFLEDLYYFSPNPEGWSWDIIGKEGDDYVIQIQSYNNGEYGQYQLQALLKPDFSIVFLEDTIEIDIEKGICVYKAGEEYFYHGCRIVEYNVEYYDQARDIYYKAVIPLFSTQESTEWREINCNILEEMERWITETDIYQHGKISLDYEIKTLDNSLYSIFFSGEFEKEGEREGIGAGITISLSSASILPKSVFTVDEQNECFNDFYIENNKLFLIINENEGSKSVEDRRVRFLEYSIVINERQVYVSSGREVGKCYYELPNIEFGFDEAEWINQQMKRDMGRFFNGVAKKFEEEVLALEEVEEYDIGDYYKTPQNYCRVEIEIINNNEGKFGVLYHYTFCLGEMYEEGDAVAVYNLEKEIVEYEDWQEEIMEKLSVANFDKVS